MNSKSLATRMLMAMALTFGIQTSAQAQLGGLVNTVKRTVKDKTRGLVNQQKDKVHQEVHYQTNARIQHAANDVEHSINNSIDNAVSNAKTTVKNKATAKAIEKTLPPEPPRPELMNPAKSDDELLTNVWALRTTPIEDAAALAKQMDARQRWILEVLEKIEEGKIPRDADLMEQMKAEGGRWGAYYSHIISVVTHHCGVNFEDVGNGQVSYKGTPTLHGGMWDPKVPLTKQQLGVVGNNNEKSFSFCVRDDKASFVDAYGNNTMLDDEHVRIAHMDYRLMRNIIYMLEGLPQELAKEAANGGMLKALHLTLQRSIFYCDNLNKALGANSPANIERRAMPKAGKLNSLRAQALAIEKSQGNASDVIDVVITRDAWDVKTNAAGVPICRVAYGYLIVKDKQGKRAISYSWAQDHQGGGKYGALRHYGNGMESFLVK